MKQLKESKSQKLNRLIDEWRDEHPEMTDWTMRDIAADLWRKGTLAPKPMDAVSAIARDLSRAAREQYHTDPQGRRVRTKHARKVQEFKDGEWVQSTLWADMRNADPEHMRASLQQRRQYIVDDCFQLKQDKDSFNDNNTHGVEIQLELDFTEDVAERELPDDYEDYSESE